MVTPADVEAFHRNGFLAVRSPVFSAEDARSVRLLLDQLFERFDTLPGDLAYDLGDVQHHDGTQQTPEINMASSFEPRLLETAVFARCAQLARSLLGGPVRCTFDHAIRKPPHNGAATEWHQDLATAPELLGRSAAHIWIPLQDVTVENGCMQFIPHHDTRVLVPHARRAEHAHALVARGVDASRAVACPVSLGGVTVHQLTTLHYTAPNTTDQPRLAWILHFHPSARRSALHRVSSKLTRTIAGRRSSRGR